MAEFLKFQSHVGDAPTFFVPDTGQVGGTANLTTPKGAVHGPFQGQPVGSDDGRFGRRLGFELPAFTYVGDYVLTVDDGNVYEIQVVEADAPALKLTSEGDD